ncbi:MAG: asparaginase [Hyphomicrobiales bacterium]|nr:MAG: asparaginase [Hyphomicrobiales bacterium]
MGINPVLVDVIRGETVESRHRGAIAFAGHGLKEGAALGDVDRPVFPRSAIKALQALALVETGAADAAAVTDAELALACASHNGEEAHVAGARAMLEKAGLGETALECGSHWPRLDADIARLHKAGEEPTAIHNNCSGKHAGFLVLANHLGIDPKGYVNADHPLQQKIRGILEEMMGAAHAVDACGIDGCSIPTYAVPLTVIAKGFAHIADPEGLALERADACRRLYTACVSHPHMVAGTKRFCTDVMELFKGRVFVKVGAEGVYTAAIPELSLGVALKCDDGAIRGAEVMMAAVINALVPMSREERDAFGAFLQPKLTNWNGIEVGSLRPSEDFARLLRAVLITNGWEGDIVT